MISHERGIYLATTYSHRTCRPTTIGAEAFHFRVRNGTGWFHLALVTRGRPSSKRAGLWGSEALNIGLIGPIGLIFIILAARSLTSTWRFSDLIGCWTAFSVIGASLVILIPKNRNQAERMISTSRLNVLPRFHLKPINVVVSDDPSGKIHLGRGLALRCFQRLSLPHIATRPCS